MATRVIEEKSQSLKRTFEINLLQNVRINFPSSNTNSTIAGHQIQLKGTTQRIAPISSTAGTSGNQQAVKSTIAKLQMLGNKNGNFWNIVIEVGTDEARNPTSYNASRRVRGMLPSSSGARGTSYNVGIRVRDMSPSGVLETLSSQCGGNLKLKVQIRNLRECYDDIGSPYVETEGQVVRISTLGTFGIETLITDKNIIWDYWSDLSYRFDGEVIINAILPDLVLNVDPAVEDLLYINRKMLKDGIACDVTIIPNNGASIKCHKNFLSAHSTVLAAMFQSKMKESHTSTLEMTDMTEKSVRALLDYLYTWEVKEADKNSLIAFELLHAGHKYDIVKLETCMANILLSKAGKWYNVEVAMKLFMFARNLPHGDELKNKAVRVLKSNFKVLEKSESYQELFKKNPEAAMELCKYSFSM